MLRVSSPHTHIRRDTGQIMRLVLVATVPGLLALTLFFGWGSLFNVALACLTAVLCEALVMKLRRRPVMFYLRDCTALVTGVLLGMALPPYCPWWLVVVGSMTAIILAKQLYGGMGFNPFNPAMVGYVVLLISFPVPITQWAAPAGVLADQVGFIEGMRQIWAGVPIDGYTAATPLDVLSQNTSVLMEDLYQTDPRLSTGLWAGAGWEWVNIGALPSCPSPLPNGRRRQACWPIRWALSKACGRFGPAFPSTATPRPRLWMCYRKTPAC